MCALAFVFQSFSFKEYEPDVRAYIDMLNGPHHNPQEATYNDTIYMHAKEPTELRIIGMSCLGNKHNSCTEHGV